MRRVLPVILIVLVIAASVAGGLVWYDNHVDRSGWVEKDGVRFYRDFHADPVSGWLELPEGRYYFSDDGTPYVGWLEKEGVTYYFDENGIMCTGWLELDGKTHYFGGNGAMVEGWLWLAEDRYFLRDGAVLTGWQEIDGGTYHFGDDGIMTSGFADLDGKRYYFSKDGVMATGMTTLEEQTYNFQEDGVMFTGWEELEGGRRYFFPEGPMATGWQEVEGKLRFFDENGLMMVGWMQTGEYSYYFHEDGAAAAGPTVIDGRTRYFTPKGIEVILVNAITPIPSDYEVTVKHVVDYHDVDARCYDALVRMLEDCNAAGIDYNFNSAYRTMEEQTEILELRTLEHMKEFDLDFDEAREKALETVAVPGTSEHQMGLAVDLLGDEAVAWFQEHCWEYGFILRYPPEKKHITGIVNEPWHFRYVGTEVSLDMKDSGLCLEEYLGAPAVEAE